MFCEAWAALVRALTFYPETNSRVGVAVDTALAAFSKCHNGNALRLVFARGELHVGGERIEFAPGTNTHWLAERLDACGVAGALFEPGLRATSLVTFCKQVLDSFRRSTLDPDFEHWTSEPVEHVHVLQRRFEGVFDGGTSSGMSLHLEGEGGIGDDGSRNMSEMDSPRGAQTAALAVRLLGNARIEARVRSLSVRSGGTHGPSAQTLPAVELVRRLIEALPAEAMLDLERAAEHTLRLLEELDRQAVNDELGPAILRAGMRLFGRAGTAPEPSKAVEPVPASRRGHSRDDGISDSLDELVAEIEQLPKSSKADLLFRQVERADEQMGVYLHYLVTLEKDEEVEILHAPLARLMRQVSPSGDQILSSYLKPLREDAERPANELHRRRLLGFLRDFDLTHLLAEHGAFSANMALSLFPQDFGVWLDSRNLDRIEDHEELVALLSALGPERILEAGPRLVADAHITDPGRARKLLTRANPALVPIARLLLARGDSGLKGVVALFVRKLESLGAEACLLAILPDEDLPRDYLACLLDPPRTAGTRDMLHRRISETLCFFIESSCQDPTRAPQRMAAVHHLAIFESPRSKQLLRDLVRAKRFLFLPAESADLREAAREALASRA